MKKALLLLFFSSLTITLQSQIFKDIRGFGNLRLDMPLSEFKQTVDTSRLKDLSYYGAYETIDARLLRYLLSHYKVSSDNQLEDLAMLFFNERLYQIFVHKYNKQTELNLTQIYGNPVVVVIEKERGYKLVVKDWNIPYFDKIVSCRAITNLNDQSEITFYSLSLTFLLVNDLVEELEHMIYREQYK